MTNPDGMTDKELRQAGPGGGSDYAYLDQTRTPVPGAGQGDGVSSAVLNPAYYPKATKPEVLHGEAEKAGAEFPTGGIQDAKQEKAAEATRVPLDVKEQQKQKDQPAQPPREAQRHS